MTTRVKIAAPMAWEGASGIVIDDRGALILVQVERPDPVSVSVWFRPDQLVELPQSNE